MIDMEACATALRRALTRWVESLRYPYPPRAIVRGLSPCPACGTKRKPRLVDDPENDTLCWFQCVRCGFHGPSDENARDAAFWWERERWEAEQ